jgi:hypothetical protein
VAGGSTSTISPFPGFDASEPGERRRMRRNQLARRAGLALLAVFVLLGATGFLGVRTRTVEASAGGYDLTVRYAQVARPALAAPWELTVHHDGGFDGPVTISTTADYFDLFDENGLSPDPASATAGRDRLVLEFDPPPGETLTVSYDARVGPNIQMGTRATTQVLVHDEPVVGVSYRTWILP